MELHVEELFIWEPILLAGTPFEINRVVLLMFLGSALCIAFFVAGARRGALVPRGIQNLAEQAYLFVRNQIAIDILGPQDGPRYANYLASVFYFIFFMNVLEITPLINFPVTSRMAIPAALALLTYAIFNFQGIRKQGLRYFTSILFPPDVPILVYLILTPIEIFSTFIIRPLTLSVRLLANMMAGHVLLTIFFLFSAQFVALDITLPLGILTALVAAVLIVFEMLVIGIQAYIFTTLTAFYIAEAIHGHGEAEHEPEDGHPEPVQETEGLEPATAGAR
jgi:F-type H+-transporting ATPase subunit a